jgi:hypothetical protein
MTKTDVDIARERQLDWLLDEVLGNRRPRTEPRTARSQVPPLLTAAVIMFAIGVTIAVALRDQPDDRIRSTPVQQPRPIQWHDCMSPELLEQVPDDVTNLRCYDFVDGALAELGRFKRLERLDLSLSRDINGMRRAVAIGDRGIPELAKLTTLRWLRLCGCVGIRGETLDELSTIPQLSYLDLSRTNISSSGLEHLAKITSLEELDLSWCGSFHGSGLAALTSLTSLRRLELAHCATLTSSDIAHLEGMRSLRHLDLSSCNGRRTGQQADLLDPAAQHDIVLPGPIVAAPVADGRGIDNDAVRALCKLRLETLILDGCKGLDLLVVPDLEQMQGLRELGLGNLPKTNTTLLHNLPAKLQSLSIRGNKHYGRAGLHALMRTSFAGLPLTELDISGIPAIDDELLLQLIAGKRLRTLRIGGTPSAADAIGPLSHDLPAITARSAIEIGKQLELEELDLRATTWLDAPSARELARLPKLHTIGLVYCTELDAGTLRAFEAAPLQNVDLYGTRIDDDDAIAIARSWPGCRVRLPSGRTHEVPPR